MDLSTSEILQSPEIVAKLKQAWQDSEPNVSGGHEEGGFIVVDDFGFLSVVRWEKGTQNEIILPPHRNCFVGGKAIVASFHTHPNTGADFQQEPSLTDVRAVRDDPDLKGGFYLGELVVSQENVYLIEPSGQIGLIGKTNEIFER
ncbi:MAG: hypothetical protein QOH63_3985 [Acidobacteriota bacterium]|jgi:hypothetical protein|nr:hypothetical protein [Acidobacteriota bacterium]